MNFDVFISYPNQDRTTAEAACAALEADGIKCWIAPRDVAPGTEWAAAIIDALDRCRAMVLIFSSHTNQSRQIIARCSERWTMKSLSCPCVSKTFSRYSRWLTILDRSTGLMR
jgi:hypothetical protein